MPTTANLDGIFQGDDYAASVNLTNPDGSAFDLTNYAIKAQLRQDFADKATVAAQFTAAVDAFMPGRINLTLPSATTTLLSGYYVWDLQITDLSGKVTTVVAGAVNVQPETTR